MLASQRVALEMSEVRQSLNELPDDATDETRDGLTTRYRTLESQYRASLITEDTQEIASDGATTEGRSLGRLQERASIMDYVAEVVDGTTLDGASREFREAVLGENVLGYMPIDFLAGRSEERADAVTNIATAIQDNQMPIYQRVFNRSSVNYLGIATPSVPVGSVSYPRLSAGTSADVRSDGVEVDGTAATITTEKIDPIRLTASYTFGMESLSRIEGFEEALRRDIQAVLEDKRDALAINGQAAVANTSPAVDGMLRSLTDPSDPTEIADWQAYLSAFDDSVDGKYAVDAQEVRLLVNAIVYRHALGLPAGTQGRGGLLRDRLPMARFRVSANLPDGAAAKRTGIAFAMGAMARGFIMPQWRGLQLLLDPYSKAKAGQRVLTATMVTGFDAVDLAGYKQLFFQTA